MRASETQAHLFSGFKCQCAESLGLKGMNSCTKSEGDCDVPAQALAVPRRRPQSELQVV